MMSSHSDGANAGSAAQPSWLDRAVASIPSGETLPEQDWAPRHRAVLWVVLLHVPALFAFGYYGGRDTWFTHAVYESYSLTQTLIETGIIFLFWLVAAWPRLSPRIRSSSASLGLITSSAVLVQFSGGYIEAHFHFFVALALLALYEDWIPFLLGISYVLVHHGTVGTIAPGTVYNHPAAIAHPWSWAAVHALFISGLSASLLTNWRMVETTRAERRRILDTTSDGLVGFDLDGTITFANPAAATVLDADDESLIGRSLQRAIPWTGSPPGPDPLQVPDGPQPGAGESQICTRRGEIRWIRWSSRPSADRGRLLGGVLTVQDVTEQKATEEILKQQAHRLAHRNEEWKQFSHAMSHELRQPARTIANYCQLLESDYGDRLDAEGAKLIEQAVTGSKRLWDLLGGLRSFLTLDTEREDVERVDLDGVLTRSLAALRPLVEETGAEVAAGPLPTVYGSPVQLMQLFQSLLTNALTFRSEGPPRILIEAEELEDAWRVIVGDDGLGIEPRYADRVFQIFQRLDPSSHPEGLGLGLTISKAVMDRHGGTIRLESTPGRGTQVILEFPKGVSQARLTESVAFGQTEKRGPNG